MRLIVDHTDFPFFRDMRVARVVDIAILLLLASLVVHAVRQRAPAPPPEMGGAAPVTRQAVLSLHADGRWTLNGELVPPAEYETTLQRFFADRTVKVLFVAADATRPFGEVMAATERARAAGITVGLLPAVGASSPLR